jgi:hypothetical protein
VAEILNKFEEEILKHEQEIRNILALERGHLEKHLTSEVRKSTQLKCTFPKIEKYVKMFTRELPILRAPKRQHVFPPISLCNEVFVKWEKYD